MRSQSSCNGNLRARTRPDPAFSAYAHACEQAALLESDPQHHVAALTEDFVRHWRMPDARYLRPEHRAPYASYLLYRCADARMSIVLDVFLPRQAAVIHNHRCWCVFACLDGVEHERLYEVDPLFCGPPKERESRLRRPGQVTIAPADSLAMHQVECEGDAPAVSLHVYGADIGAIRRQKWDAELRAFRDFVGGYSNDAMGLPQYLDSTDGSAVQARP